MGDVIDFPRAPRDHGFLDRSAAAALDPEKHAAAAEYGRRMADATHALLVERKADPDIVDALNSGLLDPMWPTSA